MLMSLLTELRRVVGSNDFSNLVRFVIQLQFTISIFHQWQRITRRFGIRVILQHFLYTINDGDVSTTFSVVLHDRQLIFGQTIFQEYQTLIGIGCILTVRIAMNQLAEVTESGTCMLRITV